MKLLFFERSQVKFISKTKGKNMVTDGMLVLSHRLVQ